MSAITEPATTLLERSRQMHHPFCFTCSGENPLGLGLRFRLLADGSVESEVDCDALYQGYRGILHGGVATSILDAAMTSCLFSHGRVGVTAEMAVQFRHPIAVGSTVMARARIARSRPPLYLAEGELLQDNVVMARAEGKFADMPDGFEGRLANCHAAVGPCGSRDQ